MSTDKHESFRQAVHASALQDPIPTLQNLAEVVGLTVEQIVHHALVRWVAAGSEALMSIDSLALDDLIAACKAGGLESRRGNHRLGGSWPT